MSSVLRMLWMLVAGSGNLNYDPRQCLRDGSVWLFGWKRSTHESIEIRGALAGSFSLALFGADCKQ